MNYKLKPNNSSNLWVIVGIVSAVLLIITVVIFSLIGEERNSGSKEDLSPTNTVQENTQFDDAAAVTAVFLQADLSGHKVTLAHSQTGEILTLDYTSRTRFTDKYDQLITVTQFVKGQVVKLNYQEESQKLSRLSVSSDIWENIGVTDLVVNKEARIINYLGKNYSYGDGTIVVSEDKVIDISEVLSMDYVTVRGFEEKIYSIVVTKGHGYLELEGADAFLGGTIQVGTLMMDQIVEGMRLTVPEGNYQVTVSSKEAEGSKEVSIERNQTSICNIEEFAMEAIESAEVSFDITPEGANLFINKEAKSYVEAIRLPIGEYDMEVSMGGYVTYRGKLSVDSLGTHVTITLLEKDSNPMDEEDELEDSQEQWKEDNTTDPWKEEEQGSADVVEQDNTSQGKSTIHGESITIQWTTGADVYFNGEYVGVIEDGELVAKKQVGTIDIDLVIGEDTVSYTVTVEDDGESVVFSFPKR